MRVEFWIVHQFFHHLTNPDTTKPKARVRRQPPLVFCLYICFDFVNGLETLGSTKRAKQLRPDCRCGCALWLGAKRQKHCTRPLDAHRNEVLNTKTACASRRRNSRRIGEHLVLVNNEDRVTV